MARREIHIEPKHRPDGPIPGRPQEATLGDLLRRLGQDASALMREEVALAKQEMKQAAQAIARDLAKVAVALSLAMVGGLALTAFLIIVIGNALDGAYWAGALIVGAVFLLIGGVLVRNAIQDLEKRQREFMDDTTATLQEDKRWAKHEAREFKQDITA